jgi:transcriptional regulator GlxA family with amidase domain
MTSSTRPGSGALAPGTAGRSVGAYNVGVFLFDEVEVLDFAGPYEVFSRTRLEPGAASRRSDATAPFCVFTVAERAGEIRATGGLRVVPDHDFVTAPAIDILVVPGGFGTRPLVGHLPLSDWLRRTATSARLVTSVCTGALLLADAGLLHGRRATTHHAAHDRLAEIDPSIVVERHRRWVDDGVVTSAGVSAGIDMAFAVVERLCGAAVAAETAEYIEYLRLPATLLAETN